MTTFRIKRPRLSRHISALGHICVEWASLEGTVDIVLACLIPLPMDDAARCITANADIRDKIQMIKGLAIARHVSWAEDLTSVIDLVDNVLRPQRNRYIHDSWISLKKGNPRQFQRAMKIKRPQARQPLQLTTVHVSERTLGEMWRLIERIALSRSWLRTAADEHSRGRAPLPALRGLFDE
jgi:hypothetical protein